MMNSKEEKKRENKEKRKKDMGEGDMQNHQVLDNKNSL